MNDRECHWKVTVCRTLGSHRERWKYIADPPMMLQEAILDLTLKLKYGNVVKEQIMFDCYWVRYEKGWTAYFKPHFPPDA